MTREEIVNSMSLQDAIQVLKDTNCYGTMDIAKTVILKALEQEPCDAVSRKEVMNMLHNHAFDYATSTKILALLKTMCGEVDRMPSVTPQYTDAEIQKMQELEQAEIQKAYELGKAEMQPCEDAISRQAALEAIEDDNRNAHYSCFASNNDAECFKQIIRELPPVTPAEKQEPREDVSDINDGNIYECPCGYGWDKSKVVRHHFCPNCGRAVDSTELEPCTDAISRQVVMEHYSTGEIANCHHISRNNLLDFIEQLPPVTPAEKVGHWVYNKNLSTHYGDVYTCSECGERCLESCYERIDKLPDFCPKCHIKMEVKE